MARRLLDDNVAGGKMRRLAIVEFQPQLAVEQDRVSPRLVLHAFAIRRARRYRPVPAGV